MDTEVRDEWFFLQNDQQTGPVLKTDVYDLVRADRNADIWLWREGMAQWTNARDLPEFGHLFPPTTKSKPTVTSPASAPPKFASPDASMPQQHDAVFTASEMKPIRGLQKITGGLELKQLLFGFTGRIGRRTYLLSILITLVIVLLASATFIAIGMGLALASGNGLGSLSIWHWIILLIGIPTGISRFSVVAKRWHDLNYSGWMQVVPILFSVALSFVGQYLGTNLAIASGLVFLAELLFYSLMPGSSGSNKYGPPPAL